MAQTQRGQTRSTLCVLTRLMVNADSNGARNRLSAQWCSRPRRESMTTLCNCICSTALFSACSDDFFPKVSFTMTFLGLALHTHPTRYHASCCSVVCRYTVQGQYGYTRNFSLLPHAGRNSRRAVDRSHLTPAKQKLRLLSCWKAAYAPAHTRMFPTWSPSVSKHHLPATLRNCSRTSNDGGMKPKPMLRQNLRNAVWMKLSPYAGCLKISAAAC